MLRRYSPSATEPAPSVPRSIASDQRPFFARLYSSSHKISHNTILAAGAAWTSMGVPLLAAERDTSPQEGALLATHRYSGLSGEQCFYAKES